MSFEVIATSPFERKVKKLAKKHKSLALNLELIIDQLASNPTLGTHLGKDCYKIRLAISSKGRGKSGGARIITLVRVFKNKVYLLDIYDKSNQANITDEELITLIEALSSWTPTFFCWHYV